MTQLPTRARATARHPQLPADFRLALVAPEYSPSHEPTNWWRWT